MSSEAEEARALGIDFVKAYYGALASGKEGQEPKEWLSANSVWTSGQEGVEPADQSHVKGREHISMQTEQFRAQQVELSIVDSQFSVEGGLFVMACGSVKDPAAAESSEPRKFIQSFFLSNEGEGYSIRNCILRFLSAPFPNEPKEENQEIAPTPEPVAAPQPEPQPEPAPTSPEPTQAAAPAAAVEPAAAASSPVAATNPAPAPAPTGKPKSFLDALSRPSKKSPHPPTQHVKKAPPKPAVENKKGGSPSSADSAATLAHHNLQAQCYVSNIPFDATNPQLRKALAKFGAIKTIVRPANKGYGFLEFENNADADRAIAETAHKPIILNNRRLNIERRTGKEALERSGGSGKSRRGRGGRGGRGRGGERNGGGGGGGGSGGRSSKK